MLTIPVHASSIMIIAHLDDDILWMQPVINECDKVYIVGVPLTNGHMNIANKCQQFFPNTQWIPVRGLCETGLYCDTFLVREEYPIDHLIPGDYIFDEVAYRIASDGYVYIDGEKAGYINLDNGQCYGFNDNYLGYFSANNEICFTDINGDIQIGRFHKELVNKVIITKLLKDIIADPAVDTIYTHNPWGEYGHAHHRMVFNAVHDLAIKYNKTVWVPNLVILDVGGYLEYGDCNLNGIESKKLMIDTDLLHAVRQLYLDEGEIAKTMSWYEADYSIVYWTWHMDNPTGLLEFNKLVSNGNSYLAHSEIDRMIEIVPIY